MESSRDQFNVCCMRFELFRGYNYLMREKFLSTILGLFFLIISIIGNYNIL